MVETVVGLRFFFKSAMDGLAIVVREERLECIRIALPEPLARRDDPRELTLCHIIEFKSVYRASFKLCVTFMLSFQRDMLRPQTPYLELPTHS